MDIDGVEQIFRGRGRVVQGRVTIYEFDPDPLNVIWDSPDAVMTLGRLPQLIKAGKLPPLPLTLVDTG
jgi:hypothetical protein